MPSSQHPIQRHEFESWLVEICPVFIRDSSAANVYYIPLSASVSLRLETDLLEWIPEDRRSATCRMALRGRETRRPLGYPDDRTEDPQLKPRGSGEFRMQRRGTWRDDWRRGIEKMIDFYEKDLAFFDKEGAVSFEAYAAELKGLVPPADKVQDSRLVQLLAKLANQKWLTPKQEAYLRTWKNKQQKRVRERARTAKQVQPVVRSQQVTAVLQILETTASKINDQWLVSFCQDVSRQVKQGHGLTQRQRNKIFDECRKHQIPLLNFSP